MALQEPQAIQRNASGSAAQSFSNLLLSTVSRFIAELGDILNPNAFIILKL